MEATRIISEFSCDWESKMGGVEFPYRDDLLEDQEAFYWLTTQPTIAEIRRLNRESWLSFPLPMLDALITVYGNLNEVNDATVRQSIYEADDHIGMQWLIVRGGNVDVILRPHCGGYMPFVRAISPPLPANEE